MDEFDVDGNPDPTKWVLCQKAGSDWNDEMSESYDQAYVKDGRLILKAEKIGDEYKAGGIETQGKFDFTFGRVEVKAKITSYPNGAFPAIWMMPKKYIYDGWPNCGEIDIMEHVKQESAIHHTIHTHYTYDLNIKDPSNTAQVTCNYQDWNIYALEWSEDKLTFFINGQETFSYSNLKLENEAEMKQWPFTKDSSFYLILNMGLGGDRPGSWAGPIDDANLPAIMEIDWVKITKLDK
jgi:beta-glucanase (GH16 family)